MNKKKVGAIILSRYSSSRLPGKALMQINGKPILEYIFERVSKVLDTESIVIATSSESSDDPIAEFAEKRGIKIFRGSLHNVAERFYQAAVANDFDYCFRINGDNIFADINLLQEINYIVNEGEYQFISNVKGRTYPKGMSFEVVDVNFYGSVLEQITSDERYKEHVTLFLYENEENVKHKYIYNTVLPEAAGLQFALDTPEDFERTERIIHSLAYDHTQYNMHEIYKLFKDLK